MVQSGQKFLDYYGSIDYSEFSESTNNASLSALEYDDVVSSAPPPLVSPPRIPPPPRLGERTPSTTVRLKRQGLRNIKGSGDTFAVRSIRRDGDHWHTLIRPFVSDLVFRSLIFRRYHNEVSFHPYTCHAAVLFVDLCGYSKITAAIAHRGAHWLSSVVNAYLSRLLWIIQQNGGDVVKFAGDAILVVWEGKEKELADNVLCAAKCVLELQDRAGSHPIGGTDLSFKIHCGLCCGILESEIFAAPTHENMQRLYHSVGGETSSEVGSLVDLAKAGEVCVSDACMFHLGHRATYKTVDNVQGPKILTGLNLELSVLGRLKYHIEKAVSGRRERRNKSIEEDFIHRSVLQFLGHGGLSPTQIAQMRNLCVLFIAMTSNGSSVNWLMEVQGVLDRNRCPIVQIIDDDKGVHIVCAINLYEAVPEASLRGLDVCRELVDKQVGCAIGMALGSTFCGVTGSGSVACRWDITGPYVVRSARLMQYALATGIEVAIDQSVYEDPMAATRMAAIDSEVDLKGWPKPCPVYGLSGTREFFALRVLETVQGNVHDAEVSKVTDHIRERKRCGVIVTGAAMTGKKSVCQKAAGLADLVPFLHVSDGSAGLLQLARTIATWFKFVDNEKTKSLAHNVLEHMEHSRWSRAHDECIQLVSVALEEELRACFVVDRVQCLDEFSISLIRECLHSTTRKHRRHSSRVSDSSSPFTSSELFTEISSVSDGKICFLCVHTNLYNWRSAPQLVEDITRSHKALKIPIVEVKKASQEELRTLFRDLNDMEIEDRSLESFAKCSGYCAGYFVERVAASRKLSKKLCSEGKRGYVEITEEITLRIPDGLLRTSKQLTVMEVKGDVAMLFSQIFDALPPLYQTFAKVLTIATRNGFYKLPRGILWEVLNDLIAEGVEDHAMCTVLVEMKEMYLLDTSFEAGEDESISLQSPALADIVMDMCTPVQVHTIAEALIEQLERIMSSDFKVPLVMASLLNLLGQQEARQKHLWSLGYRALQQEGRGWSKSWFQCGGTSWKEIIKDEIEASGFDVVDVLGEELLSPAVETKTVGSQLPLLKVYMGPVCFGPLSHTLTLICRNTFHEYGVFHGATEEAITRLRESTKSASSRYLEEMSVVEEYLTENGVGALPEDIESEREMIVELTNPALGDQDVRRKAKTILEEFVPRFVESRMQRLRALVARLRERKIPVFVLKGEKPIRCAYEAMQRSERRSKAAQDAIMTLATFNWKPKNVPELLPIKFIQTVANIRNRILKRLTRDELVIFRHQHTIDDLEAFLVMTALLDAAVHSEQTPVTPEIPLSPLPPPGPTTPVKTRRTSDFLQSADQNIFLPTSRPASNSNHAGSISDHVGSTEAWLEALRGSM